MPCTWYNPTVWHMSPERARELMEESNSRFKPGDWVSLDVPWPNGKVSRMRGVLITTTKTEAYVDTEMGPVVGPVDSLEKEEPER